MRILTHTLVVAALGLLVAGSCFAQLTSMTRSLSDRSGKLAALRKESSIPKLVPELRQRTRRLNALRTLRSSALPDQIPWIDEAIQKEIDRCLELSRDINNELQRFGVLDDILENYDTLIAPQLKVGLPEHEKDLLLQSGFSQEEVSEISILLAGKADQLIIQIRQRKREGRSVPDRIEQARKQPPQKGPRIGPSLEIVAGALIIGLDVFGQLSLLPALASIAGGVGLIGDGLAALGI